MENEIKITLPYPPSLNRLYRTVGGKFRTSKVGRDYKYALHREFLRHKIQVLDGAVSVSLRAYRPQKRGDIDNTLKVLIDSMQGVCYRNDSQIVEIHAYRFDDKNNPRVEVEIKEV